MEKYYRSNTDFANGSDDISFQIIEWFVDDECIGSNDDSDSNSEDEPKTYVVRAFGSTLEGCSVACRITNFTPFYFIKLGKNFNRIKEMHFMEYIKNHYMLRNNKSDIDVKKCKIVKKKDIFGFSNNEFSYFLRLTFTNFEAMRKSRYIFKKPICIPGVNSSPHKYTLYESNFEPFMRFAHIKDIKMAGWIRLPSRKYKKTSGLSNCNLEVEIDWKDVEPANDFQKVANFLQASWDIETYSYDRTFPDPRKKVKTGDKVSYPNEVIQIATTYKYYAQKDILVKHLLTLKDCALIDDPTVVVECCKSEKHLIKRWVEVVKNMDPDIFYTYNGDSFDCNYIIERAIICGLARDERSQRGGKTTGKVTGWFMNELSRLQATPCQLKAEYFSSSAYGDNEYNRLYVIGRLNYDLMIHMKRGMKKYPSYKLDYIAGEILKEGKNDLPAKKMFEYYDIGTPDKIKEIGEYCIQDTVLLQKIVDKQLILMNIIQLANVTSVPISYLTTKGQTIKVFSQILRKARQMDFLVPHTNFNSDTFYIKVIYKTPHGFQDSDKGRYLKLVSKGTSPNIDGQYKLDEIVDETTVVLLTDVELLKDSFYGKCSDSMKSLVSIDRITNAHTGEEDSFTGATVLEPIPGTYFEDIVVEDFASLYPTIMIAYNLCFSTFLIDNSYNNIPGVKYENIKWNDFVEVKLKKTCDGVGKSGKKKGEVCGKQAFFEVDGNYYCRIHDPIKKTRTEETKIMKQPITYDYVVVQPHIDENGNKVNQGVLPALLEELYSERKKVKRQMAKAAQEGDKVLEEILDATQLAIKVSLNSTYGFLGRSQGNLVLKPLASIVTSTGRRMIEQSKEYAEGNFIKFVRENNLATHIVRKQNISNIVNKQLHLQKFRSESLKKNE
jgi:DNA polymerase elongation subunit (family B)